MTGMMTMIMLGMTAGIAGHRSMVATASKP